MYHLLPYPRGRAAVQAAAGRGGAGAGVWAGAQPASRYWQSRVAQVALEKWR